MRCLKSTSVGGSRCGQIYYYRLRPGLALWARYLCNGIDYKSYRNRIFPSRINLITLSPLLLLIRIWLIFVFWAINFVTDWAVKNRHLLDYKVFLQRILHGNRSTYISLVPVLILNLNWRTLVLYVYLMFALECILNIVIVPKLPKQSGIRHTHAPHNHTQGSLAICTNGWQY